MKRTTWVLIGVAISMVLLIPGVFAPVLTVRGSLDPVGLGRMAPQLMDQGITDETVASIRPLLNPMVLPLLESAPGGLRGALIMTLGSQVQERLAEGPPVEVYGQTRSILGSVRYLYQVGSGTAATLILLFSVIVPLTKAGLVTWGVLLKEGVARRRMLNFVEVIAKWSMADVFAVALIIAFLAAQASQPAGASSAVVSFDARFGPGFYWFAAYCLVSLGVHQVAARWLARDDQSR